MFVTCSFIFGVPSQLFWLKPLHQTFLLKKRLILHSSPLSIETVSLHNTVPCNKLQLRMTVPNHTPFMQTCVCLLQSVKLGLGSEAGQSALTPLHIPSRAQSESFRHLSVFILKVHTGVQQGPWLGLETHRNHGQKEKAWTIPEELFILKPTQMLNIFLICAK